MTKANIGCGPIYMDGWVNIDISRTHKTDICCDILQTHFDNEYFDVILSVHCFEHLSFPVDAIEALNRFYKWLKPNGIIRIAVPDLEIAVNAYVNGGDLRFLYSPDFKAYYHKDTKAERLNFFVKAWEHQFCFDFETLSGMFADAGFKNIQKKNPNESLIPDFHHDRFISESLYIEAQKL